MAVTTSDISARINPDGITDTDHGAARELLCITESAVDALSLNRSRSTKDQKSNSSFVETVNVDDVENLSAGSQSSTASEILRRSTHASAAYSVPTSVAFLPCSTETARLVRVPVKVLREVPVPHDGRFLGSVASRHDNFKTGRKLGRLVNANQSVIDEIETKSDKVALQGRNQMHSNAFNISELAAHDARISRKSLLSEVQTGDRIMQNDLSESSRVHPMMAILDDGYLTQPINAIVAEQRPSSDDSCSTSLGTSASPIEILAKDKQTSGFLLFLIFRISHNVCFVLKLCCRVVD